MWSEEEVTNKCPLICFTVKILKLVPKCLVSVFCQYYETCGNSPISNKNLKFHLIFWDIAFFLRESVVCQEGETFPSLFDTVND